MDLWELGAREAVRHTLAAYNFGGDRGRLDELAATFADTGTLVIERSEPLVGPAAIAAGLGRIVAFPDGGAPSHVHHRVTGTYFRSVAADMIETSSYFEVLTDVGLDHWGRYRDTLVPVGDRWLFSRRQVTTDGFAERSYFRR